MKPIIGVSPLWDEARESIWILPGYLDAIRESGGIPIVFPLKAKEQDIKQLCQICNGFLLTGGDDVSPEIYGEKAIAECGKPCVARDFLEREILNFALENNMPLLGICRGIQFINAELGGTLFQDLNLQHKGISHQMTAPYNRAWHKIAIIESTPLFELLNTSVLDVNSYHHQAIKTLSNKLKAMAISEDGLIEAIYMPKKKFVQAVQWHPEFSYFTDENSRKIVSSFIQACK